MTVCHYPVGTSKWNPIEHRVFGEISKNWAGQPLVSYETVLKYLRSTKTKTTPGLRIKAYLVRKHYPKTARHSIEAQLHTTPSAAIGQNRKLILSRCLSKRATSHSV